MHEANPSVIRFVVSWLAQLVGVIALLLGVPHLEFTPRTAAVAGLVAFTWTVYLAAILVRWAVSQSGSG
jgi:hypothetical protein